MSFSKKLDFLMRLVNVNNSRLARAIAVDPSLVSRWRSGSRVPTRGNAYIRAMAGYFATQVRLDYQRLALSEALGVENIAGSTEQQLVNLLYEWLVLREEQGIQLVDSFLQKLQAGSAKLPNLPDGLPGASTPPVGFSAALREEMLLGRRGKQEAVRRFLTAVLGCTEPGELLLYSDESMGWFAGDAAYLSEMIALFSRVLARGHRVKIVHHIKRDLAELFAAIEFWLPFYLTGQVESYYCQEYLEPLFRHTMFIAPGTAAVTSTAYRGQEEGAPNLFSMDRAVVDALERDFRAFLANCQRLVHYHAPDQVDWSQLLEGSAARAGRCLSMSEGPSSLTMPEELLVRMLERSGLQGTVQQRVLGGYRMRRMAFEEHLAHAPFGELFSLPDPEAVKAGQVFLELPELPDNILLRYTADEYRQHLHSVVEMQRQHEGYDFYICPRLPFSRTRLLVKESTVVLLQKMDRPPVIFMFSAPPMVEAFFCYLDRFVSQLPREGKKQRAWELGRYGGYLLGS